MEGITLRTAEMERELANHIADMVISRLRETLPKKEPYYRLGSPQVKAVYPDLKHLTLQKWCREGKLGRYGEDGSYYVRISEIENALFKKQKK